MRTRIVGFIRSHAVGLVALIVVLSGTAYAATQVGAGDLTRYKVRSESGTVPAGDIQSVVVKCKANQRYVSGGFEMFGADFTDKNVEVLGASPTTNRKGRPRGFQLVAQNHSSQAQEVFVQAICQVP